jgi:predicted dehydrogenase/glycosyltransferase involved in cell wall biosynthesis/threonine dehydrogenase-like Zn-dependent dehydrogenase
MMLKEVANRAQLTAIPLILATDSRDPSGVGHHMIALATHADQRFSPKLAFPHCAAAEGFVARARAMGLSAETVPEGGWPDWLAREPGPLLHVHAGIGWEGHALVVAGRRAGMAVVRTEHLPCLMTDPVERQDYLAMLRHVDQMITVSHAAARGWLSAMADMPTGAALSAIPNGITPRRALMARGKVRARLAIAPDAPLLLHVGRFTPQKAQGALVDAYARVSKARPDAKLVMVGDGPLRKAVEAQIAGLGLGGVTLLSPRDDIASLMHAADLFVLPSLFEGLPLVVLEAMAANLPVIATATDGNVEALGPDHPFLVPPDEPAELAKRIDSALADPARANDVAKRQADRFRARFSAAEMTRATQSTYLRALATRKAHLRKATMQSLTRVGFIGAGGIAERHLSVLSGFSDVEVIAVADPDIGRATAVADLHGATAYDNTDAMMNDAELDAVFICVPPFAHGSAERAALAAGLPFFVEKPLSADLAMAEAIAADVAKAGLITAVGYQWRYLDTVDAARRALGDQTPQLMQGFWLDQTPPPGWWGRQAQSGGQMVEQVTHLVDTLRLLAGGVASVYGQASHLSRDRFPGLDVATGSTAILTFASGSIATLSATCLLDWNHRVGLHLFAEGLAIELSEHDVMIDTGHGRHPRQAQGDPVWRQDRDFIDAVRGKANQIRADYAEALETHRVAIAIARSMQTGEVQHLAPVLPQPLPRIGHLRQPTAHARKTRQVRSIGVDAPFRAGLFSYDEPPAAPGEVRLDLCYTGLSAGTELTFMKGTNPYLSSSWDGESGMFRPEAPAEAYPVRFMGYMEVARVSDSKAEGLAQGDLVATTFGHKTGHTANPRHDLLVPLPDVLDPILGVFVAQMGPIAANGVLHADALACLPPEREFGAGVAGRRIAVWGGGTVGLFTALFARMAGAETVVMAEPSAFRRAAAERLGLTAMDEATALQHAKSWGTAGDRGADIVFQTRARSDSLHQALAALRPQGSVIDLAFYQGGLDGLRLGEEFHHNGLRLICAQIGRVPSGWGASWPRRRLADQTLSLLGQHGAAIRDAIITHEVPFDEGPAFLSHLVNDRPEFLQVVFAPDP